MMKFQTILDEKRENEGGYVPSVVAQIEDASNNRVKNEILNLGDDAIDFCLPKEDGSEICLTELLKRGPVILSFFRGSFCEFCKLEYKALQRCYIEFQKYNATLVGISPAFFSIETFEEGEAASSSSYILSDVGNKVAAAFGLRYVVTNEHVIMFNAMGFDLSEVTDDDGEVTLSIPATFIVNTDKKIVFKFADTDYTKRADPADIIATLISISEPQNEPKIV